MVTPLVVEKHVSGAPAAVFTSWTSAEAMVRWWWPHLPDTTYVVDALEGGLYAIRSKAFGIGVSGSFVKLDRPHELVFTWTWEDDGQAGAEEMVRVRFEPSGDGTLISVAHEVSDYAQQGALRQGWESVLGRLAELV